ncbi:Glutathione transferase [Bertholletia excelsa]
MKLHGSPISTAAQRALVALYEKELEFDFVVVDMSKGEHKSESFLSLNPFGQVPAFEDGDLKLFESRAVTQYIAHAYADTGTKLICRNEKQMAVVSVWMEVEAQQFNAPSTALAWELFYNPMLGIVTDPKAVEENEAKLAKVLDVYEARLAKSKYIGCDCFTLADLHHLPILQILMTTPVKAAFESRPNVSRWASEILSRPAWKKVVALRG